MRRIQLSSAGLESKITIPKKSFAQTPFHNWFEHATSRDYLKACLVIWICLWDKYSSKCSPNWINIIDLRKKIEAKLEHFPKKVLQVDPITFQDPFKIILSYLRAVSSVEIFNLHTSYQKKSTILFFRMIWILRVTLSGSISASKIQEKGRKWSSICSISSNLRVFITKVWKFSLIQRRNLRMKVLGGIEMGKTFHTSKTIIEEKPWLTIKDAITHSLSRISLSMIRILYFSLTASPIPTLTWWMILLRSKNWSSTMSQEIFYAEHLLAIDATI